MENQIIQVDKTANPAPLGLLGFGMTTVLLNIHNAGCIPLSSMILAMGIFYGGIAQVIAGIMEWKKGNTFGTTAFISYGFFWLTLVGLLVLPKIGWWDAEQNMSASMGYYLFLWGLFTFGMFFPTLKNNRALQVVFGTLTILFFLLSAAEFTGNASLTKIAGYEGIICGASAIYTALAEIVNGAYGKTVLPLGMVKK
ncbi:acetate uptake transporter [Arachidicoccus terrestris]|uniref:acetate uptake transporter n=1 Tax=Arachidicoccus terrestris TaxID=2875539 RepID=UPI001CC60B3D|nr:acetate uptake transporter [Arachidicoccus terrestris]UAY55021.1 acetate uptake transporter [Arachidicoccus terrestris]